MSDVAYADFLATKGKFARTIGFDVDMDDISLDLFSFQREIVQWAVRQGRAAIWADTGLGKTRMQVEWLRLILSQLPATGGHAGLILAPLAVAEQTIREARDIGIVVKYVEHAGQVRSGISITNYDRLSRFDPHVFDAIVLDESSVLKNVTTKTRDRLIADFGDTPYRLACTATPAPNDVTELANHAEFLGVAKRREMLSTYFVADLARGFRVKGHAEDAMWDWVSGWALAIRKPSDLGYDDEGYELPPLSIHRHLLPVNTVPEGQFFATDLGGVSGRARVRRETMGARVETAVDLAMSEPAEPAEPAEPWLLWCGLNDEASALADAIPDSVNVYGSMRREAKRDALLDFADGNVRVLITKPSIAGWGMNWQHCARMAFVGLGDSYESYYQCIRRSYRYGQTRPVHAHVVLSELEAQIAANVERKERQASTTQDQLIARLRARREAS